MRFVNWRALTLIVLVAGLVIFLCGPAEAQCALCKASLAGSNNGKLIRNFNIGVLVLLVPPVTIFCSIFIILRRNRGE
jgi:hypothetical protein